MSILDRTFDQIVSAWRASMQDLDASPWFRRIKEGKLGLVHYKALLRETYFHAGMNPQLQAVATLYMDREQRKVIQRFYQHAISEMNHDLLALNDLEAMGVDVEKIRKDRALPATVALNAFPLMEMQLRSPLVYLGYLFHLEFMPTQNGGGYIEMLKAAGVPENALSFLKEHAEVDVAHNNMMMTYIENLVRTQEDLDNVIYGAQSTCVLHGHMICDAFEAAESGKLVF